MKTVKAIYKGNKTIKLLDDVDLADGTQLELRLEIPRKIVETEFGQRIIRGLNDAVSGKIKVIKNARDLEKWVEEIGE